MMIQMIATRVSVQPPSMGKRKLLKEIVISLKYGSISDITREYLIKTKIVKNGEEFFHMHYDERINYINKIRYHLNKMEEMGELVSKEMPSERGQFLKRVFMVKGDKK